MRNAYGGLASAWSSLDPVMTGPRQRLHDRYSAPARSSAATYPNVIAGPIVEPAPA